MRPLDRVGSLKLKLSVLIVAATAGAVVLIELGRTAGIPTAPLAAGAVAVSLVVTRALANGMTQPLRDMAAASRQLAAGGSTASVASTARDEVGELSRAFDRMAAELAETDRLRRELVANASHELRTPIAALRAVVENLADGIDEPDPATLSSLSAQVERLQGLVEQLLDLSRLEAGVAPLHRTRIALDALTRHAVATAEAAAGGDAVPVTVAIPAGLEVEADCDRLEQVLVNLLANALRHDPEGPIVVSAARTPGGVEVAVTDRGPGVPPADTERIFDRFSRQAPDRGTASGGTGLGLAISREIVELHGGTIRVDGGHATGLRVVVALPDEASGSP